MGEICWNCEEDECVCVFVCVCVCVCDVWGRVRGIAKRMCVCVFCGGELVEL